MNRAQKAELVASLNQVFAETSIVVVTHYSGLSVAEMTDLRRQMLGAGASLKVTKIQGGALGEQILDLDGIKSLATLPSLDELRAKIVGMVNTPATRIAGVLQAPGGQIARVLHAKSQLGEAA